MHAQETPLRSPRITKSTGSGNRAESGMLSGIRNFKGRAASHVEMDNMYAEVVDITVQKTEGNVKLGLQVAVSEELGKLQINGICDGLIKQYNEAHPDGPVELGDFIIAVNGLSGDVRSMMKSIGRSNTVVLTLARPKALRPSGSASGGGAEESEVAPAEPPAVPETTASPEKVKKKKKHKHKKAETIEEHPEEDEEDRRRHRHREKEKEEAEREKDFLEATDWHNKKKLEKQNSAMSDGDSCNGDDFNKGTEDSAAAEQSSRCNQDLALLAAAQHMAPAKQSKKQRGRHKRDHAADASEDSDAASSVGPAALSAPASSTQAPVVQRDLSVTPEETGEKKTAAESEPHAANDTAAAAQSAAASVTAASAEKAHSADSPDTTDPSADASAVSGKQPEAAAQESAKAEADSDQQQPGGAPPKATASSPPALPQSLPSFKSGGPKQLPSFNPLPKVPFGLPPPALAKAPSSASDATVPLLASRPPLPPPPPSGGFGGPGMKLPSLPAGPKGGLPLPSPAAAAAAGAAAAAATTAATGGQPLGAPVPAGKALAAPPAPALASTEAKPSASETTAPPDSTGADEKTTTATTSEEAAPGKSPSTAAATAAPAAGPAGDLISLMGMAVHSVAKSEEEKKAAEKPKQEEEDEEEENNGGESSSGESSTPAAGSRRAEADLAAAAAAAARLKKQPPAHHLAREGAGGAAGGIAMKGFSNMSLAGVRQAYQAGADKSSTTPLRPELGGDDSSDGSDDNSPKSQGAAQEEGEGEEGGGFTEVHQKSVFDEASFAAADRTSLRPPAPVKSVGQEGEAEALQVLTWTEVEQWLPRIALDYTVLEPLREEHLPAASCGCIPGRRSKMDVPGLARRLRRDKDLTLFLRMSDFDIDNIIHFRMLRTVYSRLTRGVSCPKIGHHWEALGFPGVDPRSTLNKTGGVLNVLHMFYFFSNIHLSEMLMSIYELSRDWRSRFPLFMVSIAITDCVTDNLMRGRLTKLCNKEGGVLEVTRTLHAAALWEFQTRWRDRDPNALTDTLKEIGSMIAKFPSMLMTKLAQGVDQCRHRFGNTAMRASPPVVSRTHAGASQAQFAARSNE